MTSPVIPPTAPRGSSWIPWLIVVAFGALVLLRAVGLLGPC